MCIRMILKHVKRPIGWCLSLVIGRPKARQLSHAQWRGVGGACLLPRMIWPSFVRSLNIGILYMSCLRSQKVPKSVWKTRFRDASNSTQPVSNWTIWTWLFYEKIVFFPFPFLCAWQPNPLPKKQSCSIWGGGTSGDQIWTQILLGSIYVHMKSHTPTIECGPYNGIPQDTYPILNPTKPLGCLKMIPLYNIYIYIHIPTRWFHLFPRIPWFV